jgi:hypothetical protein
MRHLKLPRIQILDGWKNKVAVFFTKKTHFQPFFFYPKHLENTIGTLLNQSMVFKNVTSNPKTRKQLKTKKVFELKYVFIGVFKEK